MTWRAALSSGSLRGEIDAHAPGRDRTRDGCFEDVLFVTSDPLHGIDGHRLAGLLRGRLIAGDKRIRSIVWDGRICSAHPAYPAGQWRPFTGPDPHTDRVRVVMSHFDSAAPWGVAALLNPIEEPS